MDKEDIFQVNKDKLDVLDQNSRLNHAIYVKYHGILYQYYQYYTIIYINSINKSS